MVTAAFVQFVLLSVYDDGCDLLVHKYQDGSEQGGEDGEDC